MAWLNEPVEIIDDYRVITETQGAWGTNVETGDLGYSSRYRYVTWTTSKWVGCDYDGAKAKADALALTGTYDDIHLVAAGGGQYHCFSTIKSAGNWSEWVTS